MPIDHLLLLIFPGVMLAAALFDIGTLTVPNKLTAALAVMFVPAALFLGMPLGDIAVHLAVGTGVLLAGMALFAGGYVGGGDAKLLAGAALWIDWQHLAAFVLFAGLAGGALALAFLVFRRFPLPLRLTGYEWIMRLHDRREGIPYAVALCAGALLVFPQTYWVELAV